ncbi:hypothetical protein HAHI6034_05235 [Hathewaya histolytica]|uniref:Type IV pilus assembly protein PilO n=1 Tax=Hathewaya histolytica TaxID=1498 RepID=A0A4U9R6J0_HATHI|nr:hypothetical protein [Hathewaya histolytica]VTQ86666.1 type IV pilus assembly protein PilO [Hathewaya histolytica]
MKTKFKLDLKTKVSMSEKEKTLVMVLLLVVIVYVAKTFLFASKIEELSSTISEYDKVRKKHTMLKEQSKEIPKLKKQEKELSFKYKRMERQVPPYMSEASTILIMDQEAKASSLNIKAISFDKVDYIEKDTYLNQSKEASESKEGAEKEGKSGEASKANSNPSENRNTKGPKVILTDMSIGYEGNYDAVYKFIKRLEEHERKIFINQVSMNIGDAKGLKGNLKLQLISYAENDEEIKEKLTLPENKGKFNLFNVSGEAIQDLYSKSYYTPNMVLNIKPYNEEGPKYIFSEYGKTENEIYSNGLSSSEGKLKIEKLDKNFRITYSLGKVSKTIEKEIKPKDNTLRLDVISHKRVNVDDKMEMKMEIENKTPYVIEVNVVNDDLDKPIFTLKKDEKNVALKRVNR